MTEPNEKSRVQVSVRIRPRCASDRPEDRISVESCGSQSVVVNEGTYSGKTYAFDHVLTGDQRSVFVTVGEPILEEAYKGFNVCLFAYGQTGSGKTYSLLGDVDNEESRGVAPRLVRQLFDEAQRRVEADPDLTIRVSLSMIEVYMEKVRDLLVPRQRGQEPEALLIHEDTNHRVCVKGASVHPVLSYERMMELLKKGNTNRQTTETKMNETSSRSHAIIQITMAQEYGSIEKRDLECTISLVDLAGSERQSKTESTGHQFEEAKKINHSLLMLGRALNSFSDRKVGDAYISLRESKLTRLLSESFGGNSKTWMLATVSPTAYNLTETISTLEYATNAMAITNKAHVNKSFKSLELKELKSAISSLEKSLENLLLRKSQEENTFSKLIEERNALQTSLKIASSQEETKTRLHDILQSILLSNIALKKRLEAASHDMIWSLDNETSFLFFKGRCELSLENVLLGKRCSFSISLRAEKEVMTSAKVNVQLFPIGPDVQKRENVMELVGKDIFFCLHVVGAEDIPPPFFAHVFCQVTLKYEHEDYSFTTTTAMNTCNPHWGLIKKFQIPNLTPQNIRYFCFTFFTFEVFGFST